MQGLEKLRAMLGNGTPEPWYLSKAVYPYDGPRCGNESNAIYHNPTEHHVVEVIESPDELDGECIHNVSDAELIVTLRNVAEELLAVVESTDAYFKIRPIGGDEVKEALAALKAKLETIC